MDPPVLSVLTQFSSEQRRELFNWPFGDLSFQTRDVWGPRGVVASAQKGSTPWTVKSLPIFISEKECLWGEIKLSMNPIMFNIIHWVTGSIVSSTKHINLIY